MIWMDFDDIWQKYSKVYRIEFACFSFHVSLCLLIIPLSSLKLHAEYSACMLYAVSCWARLFLQHLRRRTLWIICETDDRWIPPPHIKFLLALRFVFLTQQQRLNCVDVYISTRTASAAAQTPVDQSTGVWATGCWWSSEHFELHQQPIDAVLRPTFVHKLCYKLPRRA